MKKDQEILEIYNKDSGEQGEFAYQDILEFPHYVSLRHPQMPKEARAAQFSPFAALTGYEAAIRETARLTEARITLDEDRKNMLDEMLRVLYQEQAQLPEIEITYFCPDERKEGGVYRTRRKRLKKIDSYRKILMMEDGLEIHIEDITDIQRPDGTGGR